MRNGEKVEKKKCYNNSMPQCNERAYTELWRVLKCTHIRRLDKRIQKEVIQRRRKKSCIYQIEAEREKIHSKMKEDSFFLPADWVYLYDVSNWEKDLKRVSKYVRCWANERARAIAWLRAKPTAYEYVYSSWVSDGRCAHIKHSDYNIKPQHTREQRENNHQTKRKMA